MHQQTTVRILLSCPFRAAGKIISEIVAREFNRGSVFPSIGSGQFAWRREEPSRLRRLEETGGDWRRLDTHLGERLAGRDWTPTWSRDWRERLDTHLGERLAGRDWREEETGGERLEGRGDWKRLDTRRVRKDCKGLDKGLDTREKTGHPTGERSTGPPGTRRINFEIS